MTAVRCIGVRLEDTEVKVAFDHHVHVHDVETTTVATLRDRIFDLHPIPGRTAACMFLCCCTLKQWEAIESASSHHDRLQMLHSIDELHPKALLGSLEQDVLVAHLPEPSEQSRIAQVSLELRDKRSFTSFNLTESLVEHLQSKFKLQRKSEFIEDSLLTNERDSVPAFQWIAGVHANDQMDHVHAYLHQQLAAVLHATQRALVRIASGHRILNVDNGCVDMHTDFLILDQQHAVRLRQLSRDARAVMAINVRRSRCEAVQCARCGAVAQLVALDYLTRWDECKCCGVCIDAGGVATCSVRFK